MLAHSRFRAAYDFLVLRAEADEQAAELAEWWTRFLKLDDAGRAEILQPAAKAKKSKPRRRRKSRSARKDEPASPPVSDT